MRDRVARTRSLVTMSLVALFMTAPAEMAFAQDNHAMPFNFGGPFGIVVAAIGLSGLVLGIVRFFHKSAKARKTVEAQPIVPVTAPQVPVAMPEPAPAPQSAA